MNGSKNIYKNPRKNAPVLVSVAGLAHLVECLTAEREVAGSIPGEGPILMVIK